MLNRLFKAQKKNREDGFTLLELLIVIVIIGILAAIAVPVFNNQQTAARNATVKSDVRNTITPVQTALISNLNATGFTVLGPNDTAASISILKGSAIPVPTGYVPVHLTKSFGNDMVITNPDGTGSGGGSGYLIHGQNALTGFWSEYLSTTGKFTSSDKAGSVPIVANSRVTPGATSVAAAPFVPGWVDYPYAPTDWTGYTEYVLPASSCTSAAAVNSAMSSVLALVTPKIFNALACGAAGPNFYGLPSTITLTSNLVIVASSMSFPNSGNSFTATAGTSTTPHKKLWLIIPDRGPTTNLPDCPSPQAISVGKITTSTSGNVDGMIYSPCDIANSPVSWQGQIFAAAMRMSNGFQSNYVPVGLPGYDLTTGGGSTGGQWFHRIAIGPNI